MLIDPTYLRYIVDGLYNQTIQRENIAALPQGLIGIYEESMPSEQNIRQREKFLQFFSAWVLLKKEVSASFVSDLLNWKEQDVIDYVSVYSKWFNSPASGTFVLYHERLRVFILSKVSKLEIQNLSSYLIRLLKNDSQNKEFNDYYIRFYLDHLVELSYEFQSFQLELDKVVYQDEFWDNSFLKLNTILPAVSNLRKLISYSCFKKDWRLLQRVSNLVLLLEQKNDIICEQLLTLNQMNFDLIQICFDSISSTFNRLRFLTYLTIKIEINKGDKNIVSDFLWEQLASYVQTEYINGALFLPNWILQKLSEIAVNKQIDSLLIILNTIDLNEVDPISNSGILKSFSHLENRNEIQSIPEVDFLCYSALKDILKEGSVDFAYAYNIISTPNLMDRDALLFRASLDFMEFDYTKSYDWLYWLLVKSDFEWGGHTSPDEKYYTKNLIAKYISKADVFALKKIQDLLKDIDLYNYHVLEIKCWISDRYFRLGLLSEAYEVLIQFNFELHSTFNESEWKSAWFVSQNLDFDIEELHVSKRLDNILSFPHKIKNISFDEINNFLKPLDTDKISKAEYFLETAVRVYKKQVKLGVKLVNEAWELIKNRSDFASVIVKLETIVTGLNFMPESWIYGKLKRVKKDFMNNWEDYSGEYYLGLQNFYSYKPFRFSDRNILKLSLKSDSVKSFLIEFDNEGLENAVQDEKLERVIIKEAKKSNTFRDFWSKVGMFFKADKVGVSLEKFWTLFNTNEHIFKNVNAEDIRIIGVISRKVNQHFPIELHINKSEKLKIYHKRINIPDIWEYGSVRGFPAMLIEKDVDKETICDAILSSPRNGDEMFITPIEAVGYMLNLILKNKQLVKNVHAYIELRNNLTNQCH
jgi:hypothetical protein